MIQAAHSFSLWFKPFRSTMFPKGLPLVSLYSTHRENPGIVGDFCLYFHVISLSIFNIILWTVCLLYGFTCYETLQFLLFLLGREQTKILWKRVSNIHLWKWFIQMCLLIIVTEEVASVCSGPLVSSMCFTAVCLAHRRIIMAVPSLLSA